MSDAYVADVVFPRVISPETKRPLQAQIRFACEEGYHPSLSIHSALDKSEIDVVSLVWGTVCSFSSKDHGGMRTLRLDFFPPFAGQRDVAHVRPSSMLAPHLKLLISFSDRDKCAIFARAIKDALVEKAILKYHYSAQLLAPVDDPSGTVMYSLKISKRSQQAPSAESSASTIQRRFTAFKELHANLVSLGIPVRKLPGKDWKAVVKSKKHDPERLAAKATKLARFIEAICSHDRTAKLPAVLEFLSVGTGRISDVVPPASLLAGMVLDFEGQLCCHFLPAYCLCPTNDCRNLSIGCTPAFSCFKRRFSAGYQPYFCALHLDSGLPQTSACMPPHSHRCCSRHLIGGAHHTRCLFFRGGSGAPINVICYRVTQTLNRTTFHVPKPAIPSSLKRQLLDVLRAVYGECADGTGLKSRLRSDAS